MTVLQCWKCGEALHDEPVPFARAAQCPACRADLHVCKLCEFYATGIANDCREPIAERVVNKERANFCGYFKPRPNAWQAPATTDVTRRALDALFGGVADTPPAPAALEDLFRKS